MSSFSRRGAPSTEKVNETTQTFELADVLLRLHAHVVASGGSISSTDIGLFYSSSADGPACKEAFKKAGGLKKALTRTDKLVYVTSEYNQDLGTIEVRGSDAALPPPRPQQQQRPAANPKPDSSQKQHRPSTNPPPTLPLNSFDLPLRPDAKACPQWLKYRRCDFGVKCKYDHPDVVEETPTDGVIFRTSMDKKGCSIGWIVLVEAMEEALPTGDEQAPGSEAFFFHGQRASGFKASGTGALQSAGLELIKGDRVAELVLRKKGEKGYTVVAGSLVHCARRGQQAFTDYLDGLLAVLKDGELCETALHSLSQSRACVAVWTALASYSALAPFVVQVIELLVQGSLGCGSGRRAACSALHNVLVSGVTLPTASPLLGVIQSAGDEALRAQLVQALCAAWPFVPAARRRSFMLLEALVRKHPTEAMRLLSLAQMLELLGATLPGGDQISCYRWQELPLKLLQSETTSHPGGADGGAILTRVLRKGGDYETFDSYMQTYVGLLREDCFAAMRRGLQALRGGTLDERDMRVFTGVSIVGMSPPNVFGGAEGTIIELHAHCEVNPKNIMFGSLLALAPRGSFEAVGLVWATVAGADELPKRRHEVRIFAELAAQLNEESDAQLVSLLLRHSGQIMMAESPTFYRAYAPAIAVLQSMKPADLPFSDQIIHALQEDESANIDSTLDVSSVFTSANANALQHVPMRCFARALERFAEQDSKQLTCDSVPGFEQAGTTLTSLLDRSQAAAIHAAITHRLTVIQGPPGTGKSYTIVRMLRLLDSIAGESEAGPVLVLTYKNRSLEDILGGCMKTWPDGVARCGGAARPGSLLEHRHIKALLRNDRRKSPDLDAAKKRADKQKEKVQVAARNLSRARSFSAETVCAEEFREQLRSLLLHSPGSTSDVEEQEIMELLAGGDQSKLEAKASSYLSLWLPSKKECAAVCQAPADGAAVRPATNSARDRRGRQEQEDRAQDRNMYRSFEETAVRFDAAQHASSREVLELLNPLSDGDVHYLLHKSAENVYDLSKPERVRLMHAMLHRRYNAWQEAYNKEMIAYNETLAELRRLDLEQQIGLLSMMKVVGMTISGAAIYRDTLAALKPKHVLVEEAGEVLEPLLVATLGPWVTRLTLVGDHQQLPPSVENHQLAHDYQFNTSLMERLVNNELKHVTLTTQARMMPEMAELLLDVYPTYRTSERVDVAARCSPPPGALRSTWWWDVRPGPEGGEHIDPEVRSYVNDGEATAVVALVKHLVNSGVEPASITVLASYSAQITLIEKRVNMEIGDVLATGWPTETKEGLAARNLLRTLNKEIHAGGGSSGVHEAQRTQCIQVSETFLKLGYVSDAKKALGLAKQRGLDEAVEENWKRVDSLEKLQQKVDDFCSCVDVENARSLLNDAINALKELEGMAVRWRSSGSLGVPAAAACCVLVQDWASQIIDAGTGLSEGLRRLLQMISNSSRTHLKELRALNGITFSSIDRYQGSENDVVIISLVRSNADRKVGFLQEPARRVVAQSRARLGMYFIGDGETFESSKHWSQLTANLQGRGRRGASIPLCCPAHTSCVREISSEDADSVIQCGVCQQPCGQLMSCGVHTCTRRCHGTGGGGIDNLHMICTEPVADAKCAKGHAIKRLCFQATEDVVCPTCARIEEEREKAERERREMEERAARECEQILSEVRKMPPQLQKHDLQKHGADAVEYMQVVDRAERYAQSDHGSAIVVSRIEKVTNPLLEKKFLAAKLRLKSGVVEPKMQRLFHGTGAEGVEGIPKTGVERGQHSFQQMYTKGSGCLLLCDVLLGNSCEIAGLESRHPLSRHVKKSSKGRPFLDMSKRQLRDAGFDSVYASRGSRDKAGVQYDEMMVYDTDQAIPRYILHIGGCGQRNLEWRAPLQRLNNGATVRKIKEADVGVTDSKELEEFNKAVGHYMRLMGPGSRKVTQVDVYESPMVEKAFQDKEASFRAKKIDTKKIWVFHGTAEANIEPICGGGFRVAHGDQIKNGAAHGHGVYTAKGPQTPMGYADGTVILSLALPGTTGQQGQADSWTPGGDWMIFKTGEQLCPKYVVRYT